MNEMDRAIGRQERLKIAETARPGGEWEAERRRGQEARRLLEDPVFLAFATEERERIVCALEEEELSLDQIVHYHHELRAFKRWRQHLERLIQDGEAANQQILRANSGPGGQVV